MRGDRGKHKRTQPAFTLIECVIVLAIMGAILVVTVPRVGALYDRELLEEQVQLLENDLIWLRSEARRTGAAARFERAGSGAYRLTVEGAEGRACETRELVSPRMRLETSSLGGAILFEPRGTAYEKCTVTLRVGEQTRTLVVNNLGRIRVGVAG